MSHRVYLSPPDITEAEEDAILRAIRSGWVAPLGPEVDAFEAELATYCGRGQAVALASGTAALHLSLLALGVGPGQYVPTSTMTFVATANAITYTGATPVFIDSDASGNLNPDLLDAALHDLLRQGIPLGAIVPVDLLGRVVDHDRIDALATQVGVPVLSDAAESLGSCYRGRSAAGYGRVAAVSFNGNKVMTTSGGGAVLTDDEDLAARVRYLATQARQPLPHYEHTDVGYNYRLSNLLAAIGRVQLRRLGEMMQSRRAHRNYYRSVAAQCAGVEIFGEPSSFEDGTDDNCWLTSLLIDPDVAGFTAADVIERLRTLGVEARPMWKPMHLQPVYAQHPSYVDGTSESIFRRGVSLPSGSSLANEDRELVGDTLLSMTRA